MGDARLNYDELTYGWFDHFLKGEDNKVLETMPKVRYYLMGANQWKTSNTWPPEGAQPLTLYLTSGGKANSLNGDGALVAAPPAGGPPDNFTYDPMNPVPSYGGNVCCTGNAVAGGSFDQRKMEARADILVYSTEPLTEGLEVSGSITAALYVSSDAKDTDFTVKLIDVYPDGRAYNLDETIQRMRYREGYDKPAVWMEKEQVYKVTFSPLTTSNYFAAGHRIRIEISSSNFPRFDRNLNTGGNNYDESNGVVAHNSVHHSQRYPSQITLTVVLRISSGDDAICLKSSSARPCRDVVISNCVASSHCNAIKLGTESNGGFENINISNCALYDTRLAGLALEIVDGGTLDNVVISGITMRGVQGPIFVRLGDRGRPFLEGDPKPPPGKLGGVLIQGIQATGAGRIGCSITGLPNSPVRRASPPRRSLSNSKAAAPPPNVSRDIPELPDAYPEYSMFKTLPAYALFCGMPRTSPSRVSRPPTARTTIVPHCSSTTSPDCAWRDLL